MEKKEILTLSAIELAENIREQKVTSEEAVRAVFENIDEHECKIHAYLDFWKEESLKKAREIDEMLANRAYSETALNPGNSEAEGLADPGEELPPLLGVPVAVKDNLMLSGRKMTCGSKMLQDYIAPYSATCIEKLEKAKYAGYRAHYFIKKDVKEDYNCFDCEIIRIIEDTFSTVILFKQKGYDCPEPLYWEVSKDEAEEVLKDRPGSLYLKLDSTKLILLEK